MPAPAPRRSVTATAHVTATRRGRGTDLPVLRGEAPLALRRTRGYERHAYVTVVGAMSAPLGGDRLRLETTVEAGATLHLDSSAATLALPGQGTATYETRHTVADDATLYWLPEPLISVHGSDLRMTTHVELAASARLVLREEQVLGRFGEAPGRLTTRLTVTRAGVPLLDQELAFGPGAPGWDSAAVLCGHRATGQYLVVDPALETSGPPPDAVRDTAVRAALAGPAVLISAVAGDGLRLRRDLTELAAPCALTGEPDSTPA